MLDAAGFADHHGAMDSYPLPARQVVARLTDAAAAAPDRAVAFQGAPGAYSHLAVTELFPDAPALPCFDFEAAFEAVQTGRAGCAVIPIENSQAGRVADIHFLLPASDLFITGEHFLRVRHCLLGLPGTPRARLREAISHPQALGQCRQRLRDWGIKPVQYADTAGAAALIAERQDMALAAIASDLAARTYGLDVLEAGIEDVTHNTTRFIILANHPANDEPGDAAMMTSFLFEVRSIPAALYKALGGFATNGVNITKLESYLVDGNFAAAQFYCDIEGVPEDPSVALALEELRFHSKWVRILGSYRQARTRVLSQELA